MSSGDRLARQQSAGVTTITAGTAVVLDARMCKTLTIISGTGATVGYSRVDSPTASAHTTGTENAVTGITANTKTVVTVDWPFYRINTAGGPCRISLV